MTYGLLLCQKNLTMLLEERKSSEIAAQKMSSKFQCLFFKSQLGIVFKIQPESRSIVVIGSTHHRYVDNGRISQLQHSNDDSKSAVKENEPRAETELSSKNSNLFENAEIDAVDLETKIENFSESV